jgi:hypothetical protein
MKTLGYDRPVVESVVREYMETNTFVNTGCDDLAEKIGEVTGLHLINDYEKIKNRIRYVLNKMVKLGELRKQRVGTDYCGKIDFGFTHFNMYIKTR